MDNNVEGEEKIDISSEILFHSAIEEYKVEDDKRKTIDTRIGIFIPIALALLMYGLNNVWMYEVPIDESLPLLMSGVCWLYLISICAIILFNLISIFFMLYAASASEYKRLDMVYLVNNTNYSKDVFCLTMSAIYTDAITHNRGVNENKIVIVQRGIYCIVGSLITSVLSVILLIIIKKGMV